MPRTIDHLVQTHQIARERRTAGQKVWEYTIDLSAFWGDEDLEFEERRDRIVAALRQSTWIERADEDDELHQIIEEMSDTDTPEYFDLVMDALYDAADIDRAWIKTF